MAWGACGHASSSTAVLPFVEDISLPARCKRSLGNGKYTLHQAGPEPYGRSRTGGSDGHEIPVSLVYDQVALAAKYSQQDCKLDSLLDGIEEEYSQSK